MSKKNKIVDSREPLNVLKGDPPEDLELKEIAEIRTMFDDSNYRRGYFHGYLKGMKTVEEFGYADTYEFLWNDIKEWRNGNCAKVVQPPELTE